MAPLSPARPRRPRFFGVLREVAAWRETAAQQRNLPRGRIMRDEAVLEIAAHAPKTIEALARTRSLGKGVAEGQARRARSSTRSPTGLADPSTPPPPVPAKAEPPPGIGPLLELLRVLLKQRCEEHQVAQKLLASADDLEAIAADDEAPVRALSGWRREMFGRDALALKHGRLALTVRRQPDQARRPLPEDRQRLTAKRLARASALRAALGVEVAQPEGAAERIEAALHRFADKQAAARWHFEDEAYCPSASSTTSDQAARSCRAHNV